MADIELVIKIDDNLYTRLFDNGDIDAVDMLKACGAIRKGTALPKGHGRLIDADALENHLKEDADEWDKYALARVKDAPTIIPAESEEA